jgi:hypothetical protein
MEMGFEYKGRIKEETFGLGTRNGFGGYETRQHF